MRHAVELTGDIASHMLGVALGRHDLGIGRFQIAQLMHELVEGGVGDLGIVERVIPVGMVVELAVELGGTGKGVESRLSPANRSGTGSLGSHLTGLVEQRRRGRCFS